MTHRVVVIGSGFGGLFSTKALKDEPVEVTLIARTAHHLFQPLLYQVATGILSEGEIAPSTREILRKQPNATVLLGEVTEIDLEARTVTSTVLDHSTVTPYDTLIVAAGAGQSYFGNDHFAEFAPGMKTIEDALTLRAMIFGAFEVAEVIEDEAERARALTFVVIGAGPTGVEIAGQIAELSRHTLKNNFRRIDPAQAKVILVDGLPGVLTSFGDRLGRSAQRTLEKVGVEVVLNTKVVDMDMNCVMMEAKDGSRRRVECFTKVWAAGVQASGLSATLSEQSGATVDRAGRILVQPDLTLPGHPEVFVVGDMASLKNYPGVAQVAIQGGEFAAEVIRTRLNGEASPTEFAYKDRGSMATISRYGAVASIGKLRLTGPIAWLAWLFVHLINIIGFKQRFTTLMHWAVSFVTYGRVERALTATAQSGILGPPRRSIVRTPQDRPTAQVTDDLE